MQARQGFTLIEVLIVVVIIGILVSIGMPNYISMQNRAKESKVTANAHTLQLAAEDFSTRNNGTYSAAQVDILALLPGSNLLYNAFTGGQTEPQFGALATTTGQVGIVGLEDGGHTVGYHINGWGEENQILVFSNSQ